MTYSDEAAAAARAMWTSGLKASDIRAVLDNQHPRMEGWTTTDVHRAVGQGASEAKRGRKKA